jgi:hypothetical protein
MENLSTRNSSPLARHIRHGLTCTDHSDPPSQRVCTTTPNVRANVLHSDGTMRLLRGELIECNMTDDGERWTAHFDGLGFLPVDPRTTYLESMSAISKVIDACVPRDVRSARVFPGLLDNPSDASFVYGLYRALEPLRNGDIMPTAAAVGAVVRSYVSAYAAKHEGGDMNKLRVRFARVGVLQAVRVIDKELSEGFGSLYTTS